MTINVEFTEDDLGVYFHEDGTVTAKEIESAMMQVYQNHRYPELKYWIINATAEVNTTSFEDMKKFAELEVKESRQNPGLLIALVADTDHIYGMTRLYQAFAKESASTIKVFISRETADEWVTSKLSYMARKQALKDTNTRSPE